MVPVFQWTMANTAALLMFVQTIMHKKSEVCMCLTIWAPISKPKLSHISNTAEKDVMFMEPSKKYSPSIYFNVITGAACTSSCEKWGFSFDQKTTHLFLALW